MCARSVAVVRDASDKRLTAADDVTVTLDIRNSAQTEPGWTNVTSSNGAAYSYRYAGGSDGSGNVTERGRGNANCTLVCDPRVSNTN
jgi:hypothetical protein